MAEPLFVGEWDLLPELCLYQTGEPPPVGRYHIAPSADGVFEITIEWETAAGDRHTISFGGPADGRPIASSAAGVSHITLTLVDAQTLDSAAFDGQTRLSYARRRASRDAGLLSTVQESPAPGGGVVRNFQVYRRR